MQAARDLGQTAMAVTDHGTLTAHREFQRAAVETGVKPILGLEAYFAPTDRFDRRTMKQKEAEGVQNYNHLIILAKNQTGLDNLQHLSELAWTEGYYHKPRIDYELLSENSEGLIVLSGCRGGLIAKAIERGDLEDAERWTKLFVDLLGEDFYMEVQSHNPVDMNNGMLDLADKYGIKSVATADCHFARAEDRWVEEAMLILSTKPKKNADADFEHSRQIKDIYERLTYLYPERPISFADINVYVTNRKVLQDEFVQNGFERTDIYDNTFEIAEKIGEYEYNEGLDLLPSPKGDPNKKLRELCELGLARRGMAEREDARERLDTELAVIEKRDFPTYFMVVAEKVAWAKRQGIRVGPGRGSAAGSLVCYSLGITEVDPLKYDLLFGRFINEERNDYPDIDTDYADSRRKEVKDYLVRKFGNVASISTFGRFADKGVVRDAARVFGVPLKDVNQALKTVDTFEEYENSPNTSEFRRMYPEVTDLARRLRGRVRTAGMHAGGIVVANRPISELAPIETRKVPNSPTEERMPVVAWDMEEAESLGLIKLDVLGLKALSVVDDALKAIKDRYQRTINPVEIPLDDPKVFADMTNGFTRGIFQAEATPYTNLLKDMGVENFHELAASTALVRPGAMNTVGKTYIARKQGREQVRYIHPIMEEFTSDTYGVIIYQEQVMQACVYLAGMSWSDADRIRKIIGKKKDPHEFDAYRQKFIDGATKHITEDQAAALWHDFEAHAGYSFNKSHAVAYSMLTYWTAWLKHYYPLEFMWATLVNEKDKNDITEYLIETKRLGITVNMPHVNYSESNFSIQGNTIRFGLSGIKYISDKSAAHILRHRPFHSYHELTEKAAERGSGISSRMIESLNKIGAAAFPDNPVRGDERNFFYEYLSIPTFDKSKVPTKVIDQVDTCEDFEERGCYVIMAMVKSIKRGKGWARVEMVDDTGSIGVFHEEQTIIAPGEMYVFLIGDNRIHRFINVNDIRERVNDSFIDYLKADELPCSDSEYFVVDFMNYRTKAGKMMAHTIIAKKNKEMKRAIVFPKQYGLALSKMKPGKACSVSLGTLDDGTKVVREFSR